MSDDGADTQWLVLAYQFPKGPGSARVKVWRRLQSIGALAIKNSVYVLPLNDQSREDFAWLLTELKSGGADGVILESRFVDGMRDQQVRELFNAARDKDYAELGDEIEQALAGLPAELSDEHDEERQAARNALGHARKRMAEIEAIDFFGAERRVAAEAALRKLNDSLSGRSHTEMKGAGKMSEKVTGELRNRVWVTRSGVRVDRIASAWLIRRWIDPDARFKFVPGKDYAPQAGELRFDMFEAEFTHQGDLCTFEVLARQFRKDDAALRSIGEIVHDIDLKDGKFGRPETQGVANLLSGIVAGSDDDELRIERGSAMFEDLYRFFDQVQP
ncbi:MAG: chromate resistance protein [Woeseiaceae bacterium]|nr:chromate resistance protein [Woeseiaceae bacterium]